MEALPAMTTAYDLAKQSYADLGIDTETAIQTALQTPISVHCWQADDVRGLEHHEASAGGGILSTGSYPGLPRDGEELRADLAFALKLLPGTHRLNLHALYAETGGQKVDRDELTPDHFTNWIGWAKDLGIRLDFNPTFFAHPKADSGMTLAHADNTIRQFWVRHGIASRKIAQAMAEALDSPCTNNVWIPDGLKDSPADRWSPRQRLIDSLDAIFDCSTAVDQTKCIDAVESKLFGLGSEDYVVGSFEFYSHYALTRGITLCLDMGHFHPTETIHDKISALLGFHKNLLLHVSRPLRWDSDHVVIFNDDLRALFHEIIRGNALDRVTVAMDFFDGSINRTAAYVTGARATRLGILNALLDPTQTLKDHEAQNRSGHKLALMERLRTLPLGAVWDELCQRAGVPTGVDWLQDVDTYEQNVLSKR
ncbi:L-rhamnose isomerase [Mucisphaera sp.]|uniref:L-rhamnose isomerase n=1 Tax=Mucisphaera sp. TaxID=2913024 RepID=UPI003D0A240B